MKTTYYERDHDEYHRTGTKHNWRRCGRLRTTWLRLREWWISKNPEKPRCPECGGRHTLDRLCERTNEIDCGYRKPALDLTNFDEERNRASSAVR